MIDLHCHILPGIDDGAADESVSLAMARAFVADGVSVVACTPHILPGLYHNNGPQIRVHVANLQAVLDQNGIPLRLVCGADIHIAPNLAGGLRNGSLLTLAESRYLLVEPPHHIAPSRLEDVFFDLMVAGYIPILTHPERLTWIRSQYDIVKRLVQAGVLMQVTAGSLTGSFGKHALYWAEKMLHEGLVHILATDAHDNVRRPPMLSLGRERAERLVGADEANHLVVTRPEGVIANESPANLPLPFQRFASGPGLATEAGGEPASGRRNSFAGRLRSLFER